jgi:hypothetical protein
LRRSSRYAVYKAVFRRDGDVRSSVAQSGPRTSLTSHRVRNYLVQPAYRLSDSRRPGFSSRSSFFTRAASWRRAGLASICWLGPMDFHQERQAHHRVYESFRASRAIGRRHHSEESTRQSGGHRHVYLPIEMRSFQSSKPHANSHPPPHPATAISTHPSPAKSKPRQHPSFFTQLILILTQTHNNLHRQRLAITHLHRRRRRQPARHRPSQRPRNGGRMRRLLRLFDVPRHRRGRGAVRQNDRARRRRERYAGSGVWAHRDE